MYTNLGQQDISQDKYLETDYFHAKTRDESKLRKNL